tara:strand:- start:1574 stop:1864 length:291 start_codon:yes stop_codon:yes gene_type:complete
MGKKEKNLLGSISPLYGAVTGRGAFGKLTEGGPGLIGLMSSLRDKKTDDEEKARKQRMMTPNMKAAQDVKRMAAGGRARKRPLDGIATKGKTRALY